ncbi:MAG: sulfatase [Haloplanus sp.]
MASRGNRPNVLLVVCDTLRPDFLSPYGSDLDTPFFDRVADAGTVFENAYAAGPGSSISHAALFSGQYPSTSGVGGQVDVPTDIPHIAERFSDAGYETFGMPGPSRIGSHWNYDRGFDEYLEKWADIPSSVSIEDLKKGLDDPTLLKPMPKELLRRAVRGDDDHASYLLDVFANKTRELESPWFSFVNVTIAHGPYDPPRPYKEEAVPELERPRFGFLDSVGDERVDRADVDLDRIAEVNNPGGFVRELAGEYLSSGDREVLRSLYGASVRYLDAQLANLCDTLESAGELENTVVVLLSDHGEYLGERGLTGHMFFHFGPCLHVPLVLSGPGVPAGEHRSDFVSLVDVFPTLCDLTGVDTPPAVDGHSVFGDRRRDAAFAENGARDTPDVGEDHFPPETMARLGRGLKSVRTADYLFTRDDAGEERLYERPDETEIPLSDGPADELRAMLRDTLGEDFPPGTQAEEDMSEAVESNLRKLGYIE